MQGLKNGGKNILKNWLREARGWKYGGIHLLLFTIFKRAYLEDGYSRDECSMHPSLIRTAE